jgi:hypothetical protein
MAYTLLRLRRIDGSHEGVNIAKVVMRVITNFKIEDNIRAFVTDNASSNDTVVNSLLE